MARQARLVVGVAVLGMMGTAAARAQADAAVDPASVGGTTAETPPADRPLIRKAPQPVAYTLEGGAGLLGYLGGTGRLGPAWNVRVTAEITPRLAGEVGYLGAVNERADEQGTLMYTTVDLGVRYNILLADQAPVQPYVTAGLGYAGWIGPGGSPAALVIPVAVGVERLLTEHVKIGARLNVRPSFGENLAAGNERGAPGGSTWVLLAGAGGAF
jgi:hypothetical protein